MKLIARFVSELRGVSFTKINIYWVHLCCQRAAIIFRRRVFNRVIMGYLENMIKKRCI